MKIFLRIAKHNLKNHPSSGCKSLAIVARRLRQISKCYTRLNTARIALESGFSVLQKCTCQTTQGVDSRWLILIDKSLIPFRNTPTRVFVHVKGC